MKAKFEIGGISATGKTVTEAREKVDAKVRALRTSVDGEYAPTFVDGGTHFIFLWREPEFGWTYRIIGLYGGYHPPVKPKSVTVERLSAMSFRLGDPYELVLRGARRHLAQILFDPANGVTGEDVIEDDVDRREHLGWVEWQAKYALAIRSGATSEEARLMAGGLKPMPAADPVLVPPSAPT